MRAYGRSPETEARYNFARTTRIETQARAERERHGRGLRSHAHHSLWTLAVLIGIPAVAFLTRVLSLWMGVA